MPIIMEKGGQSTTEPQVIAKTPRWLVLLKPAGWLTIPGRTSAGATSAPVLFDWAKEQHDAVWTVHRLDRETSGVVLFARTAEDHRTANTWFQEHQIKKSYDLLASGALGAPLLKIQAPIEESPAMTQVELKENFAHAGCFRARATPTTGRRHQIRIHLASRRHPLLGDKKYGGAMKLGLPDGELSVGRVALHASRLELPTREAFEAPWPDDFSGWVEALRKKGGSDA